MNGSPGFLHNNVIWSLTGKAVHSRFSKESCTFRHRWDTGRPSNRSRICEISFDLIAGQFYRSIYRNSFLLFSIHMHSKNEGKDERIRLVARRTFAPVSRFSTFGFFVFGSCRWIRTAYNGDFSMRQYMYIALCRNNARNIWSLTASCK